MAGLVGERKAFLTVLEYAAHAPQMPESWGRLVSGLRAMGFMDVRWRQLADKMEQVRIQNAPDGLGIGTSSNAYTPAGFASENTLADVIARSRKRRTRN
ncbi:MAG: hypothetical protein B7Z66_14485 [Chromatiales bacterium 21-64-14]|nr:MAG: hypothetical protein B7Z66_14485 [Chromatiales bacterium 21-64-14]